MNQTRWRWHLLAVALLAAAVGVLFLREPGFGDDLTYWSFAFDLHERGVKAWSAASFHNLRWPVWGVCWLWQAVLGPGLTSYYGEPILYLMAGALLAFTFGRLLTGNVRVAWAAAIAFLFHPLLDTVCHRPMPDLSEGVWGAVAVLCWWRMVQGPTTRARAGWAVLVGAAVYLDESNRLTGIFIAPVLLLCTLVHGRKRFGWLCLAGGVAAALYVAEAAVYHQLFGDWLHNLHANLAGKGKKGTEAIFVLKLPFRFLDALVKESRLSWLYAAAALFGLWSAWREPEARGEQDRPAERAPLGRVLVVWLIALYLAYACAPQSVWPWRPVLRDADRFLAGLAIPMAVLAAVGLAKALEYAKVRQRRWGRWIFDYPLLTGALAVALLAVAGGRPFFSLGFVPEMRRYLRSLPPGTKVFTHTDMRQIVYLVDASSAPSFHWLVRNDLLAATPALETLAAQADEFWYARKLVWLNTRKRLEQKSIPKQEPLPTYFDHPDEKWSLARLLAKGDTPDFVFYRRRQASDPAPHVLRATAGEWQGLVPLLPWQWQNGRDARSHQVYWPIPENLRGEAVRLELEAASPQVQAMLATVRLYEGKHVVTEYVLKPYLHPGGGKEFFVLALPPKADQCSVHLKFAKDASLVEITGFQAIFERELAAP